MCVGLRCGEIWSEKENEAEDACSQEHTLLWEPATGEIIEKNEGKNCLGNFFLVHALLHLAITTVFKGPYLCHYFMWKTRRLDGFYNVRVNGEFASAGCLQVQNFLKVQKKYWFFSGRFGSTEKVRNDARRSGIICRNLSEKFEVLKFFKFRQLKVLKE